MNDVTIEKQNGGLARRSPSGDMISGLFANAVAVVGGLQLNTTYRLKSTKDALALLIDAAYDVANSVLLYEHISEFFRVNPNGDLWLRTCAKTVTYANMLDKDVADSVKQLLVEANGDIKQVAIAYNPTTAVTDFAETLLAIAKAQALATEEFTLHRPVQVVLEGKGFKIGAPTDLRALNAKNVSVMIGQAFPVLSQDSTYAAVGTLLGVVSLAKVNECIAWVQKYNMYGGNLTTAAIGGISMNDKSITEGLKETLNDYGCLFFRKHTGFSGFYFNDSHTCTDAEDDYAYIENNRTIDKASRNIRKKLLPKLNAPVIVDKTTGQLSAEVVKLYEGIGKKALEEMQNQDEVSGFDILVDPVQNILATSLFEIQFDLIPTGTNRNIKAILGFTNPF